MMEGEGLLILRIHEHAFVNIGPPLWLQRHENGISKVELAKWSCNRCEVRYHRVR